MFPISNPLRYHYALVVHHSLNLRTTAPLMQCSQYQTHSATTMLWWFITASTSGPLHHSCNVPNIKPTPLPLCSGGSSQPQPQDHCTTHAMFPISNPLRYHYALVDHH